MWKIRVQFSGRENLRKNSVALAIIPTIAIMTRLFNKKTGYILAFVWLFFELDFELRWE